MQSRSYVFLKNLEKTQIWHKLIKINSFSANSEKLLHVDIYVMSYDGHCITEQITESYLYIYYFHIL